MNLDDFLNEMEWKQIDPISHFQAKNKSIIQPAVVREVTIIIALMPTTCRVIKGIEKIKSFFFC